jgi:uncharacterized OsmC-like protein
MTLDQPRDEGGTDEGMTPVECLAVSLGSCVAYFAARFAQRHALPIQDLRVTTGWDYAEQPHRVGNFDVQVSLGGTLDAAMRDRLQRVAEACTVHPRAVPGVDGQGLIHATGNDGSHDDVRGRSSSAAEWTWRSGYDDLPSVRQGVDRDDL